MMKAQVVRATLYPAVNYVGTSSTASQYITVNNLSGNNTASLSLHLGRGSDVSWFLPVGTDTTACRSL